MSRGLAVSFLFNNVRALYDISGEHRHGRVVQSQNKSNPISRLIYVLHILNISEQQ